MGKPFWQSCSLLCLALALLRADVRLPALISDHMLLQRDLPLRIWGWAEPGEQVTVRLAGQTTETVADSAGRWEVWLRPMAAGGPHELVVRGRNTISVRDVLVGEVWVASGQSNMAWPVERSRDPEKEAAAANYPRIRLFKVGLKTSEEPLEDVEGAWQPCNPETVKGFSAVGYFFARHLHERLGVPVGVIQSAWGGTPAQAWTSRATLVSEPTLQTFLIEWNRALVNWPRAKRRWEEGLRDWERRAAEAKREGREPPPRPSQPPGPGHPHTPAGLFNAMIHPLTPYAIRGAIWYQGESNATPHAHLYRTLFEAMIRDWRQAWGLGDFPFLFVQLASYGNAPPEGYWSIVQEAQLKALELRNTAMAVTIDIGEEKDIHPKNKQDVGLRLALAARALVYGEKIVYSGPIFRQLTREGDRLRLWFDHAGGGLRARGGSLKEFLVAGADRVFHPAHAAIEADTVVVWSAEVKEPVAVRYAWANFPEATLFNAEGLPASPFRTDNWTDARLPGDANQRRP
ncbi:MAG: sialate O-acetylesterase [Bryobacterales bacterium]|nr:sialate O-acetylesterase [Bryobacteraceae bacterium]MDW8129377.1 sialate O-acetylesterase [Bryobacterales bacterium]